MCRIAATRIAILGPEAALEPLLRFCAILAESRFWDQNRFQNRFQNRPQNRPKSPTLTTPIVEVTSQSTRIYISASMITTTTAV